MHPIVVARGVVVPVDAIEVSAARSSGPGGQNVNKVSSKVEMRVDLDRIATLTTAQLERLRRLCAGRLDAAGRLLVTSQLTRSQPQNLEDAAGKVRALVATALVAPKRRIPTRPTRAARARRVEAKQRAAKKKRNRRSTTED